MRWRKNKRIRVSFAPYAPIAMVGSSTRSIELATGTWCSPRTQRKSRWGVG
jgi:hypothetical protein